MGEQRRHRRFKRKLRVEYSQPDGVKTAYTSDLSSGGIFINASSLPPLDSRLRLQLFFDETRSVVIESTVRRHKLLTPEGLPHAKSGFGARFLTPEELMAEVLGDRNRLQLRYPTPDALKVAYETELKFGAVFIPTDRQLVADSEVTVDLSLGFISRSFDFSATVLQVLSGSSAGASRGLEVRFKDRSEVDATLRPFITA
jgi:Tfp pilus assembly protein PilZ